jgi:hypothetical protein
MIMIVAVMTAVMMTKIVVKCQIIARKLLLMVAGGHDRLRKEW